jgi:hypothetical protein
VWNSYGFFHVLHLSLYKFITNNFNVWLLFIILISYPWQFNTLTVVGSFRLSYFVQFRQPFTFKQVTRLLFCSTQLPFSAVVMMNKWYWLSDEVVNLQLACHRMLSQIAWMLKMFDTRKPSCVRAVWSSVISTSMNISFDWNVSVLPYKKISFLESLQLIRLRWFMILIKSMKLTIQKLCTYVHY